ncbi:MAG: 3-dehydroquinate synthase [Acidobacteria bacterium]|nr:3-dehydroquinate synthase [Acidobacteriota bacterium]
MKSVVRVPLGERAYDITIAEGALGRIGSLVRAALGDAARRVAIFSNARVYSLCGHTTASSLRAAGFGVDEHLMGDGERAKSLRTAERAWSYLIERRFERGDAILALGGGVVGDMAGFVAATYQRGVPYIQAPTTLLAQIDSSVGGKTAVNHSLGKNLIGAFHQPRAVIIDPLILHCLPAREFRAGLYEAVKYGIIRDAELAGWIDREHEAIAAMEPAAMTRLIARCCEIKAEVVTADERESGLRQILNYGHTVGHALEAVTHYRRLKHGEAVAYGMKCAARIAEALGILNEEDRRKIARSVDMFGVLPKINDLDPGAIIAATAYDKKVSRGKVKFILPTQVGSVITRDDVPMKVLRGAVREMLR